MVNAGHTWIGSEGQKVMVQQLPIALVNPEIPHLLISPGAGIHVPTLMAEIERFEEPYGISKRLRIHPRAVIIEQRHADEGSEHATKRAGVGKGCSRANAEKSMRRPTVKLARDVPELKQFIKDTDDIVNNVLNSSIPVLAEGAQGFDLDINHGYDYPHCTSRQTTPTQVLADCGIDGKLLTRSIAVVRTYPIRVGNVEQDGERIGYSGDYAGSELSWREVSARSGADLQQLQLTERTTVTKRIRRVFEISFDQIKRMSMICRPTEIALTFADYLDMEVYGKGQEIKDPDFYMYPKISHFIRELERSAARPTYVPRVTMVKTGPQENHIIHRANYGMAPLWQMVKFGERPTVSEIESVRAELPEAAEAITALESEER
jgi:adenylosuccinate synthase